MEREFFVVAQAGPASRGHAVRRAIDGSQAIPWCLLVCLVGLACSRSGLSSKSSGRVVLDAAAGSGSGGTSGAESAGAGGTGERGGAGGQDGRSGGAAGSDVKVIGGTAADAAAPAAGISATSSARTGTGGQTTSGGQNARLDAGSAGAAGTVDAGSSGWSPDASGKYVGNITTREKADPTGFIFSDHWDALTPENAGFWGAVQRTLGGAFNWSSLDALYQYAEQKGIAFAEHCFIYGAFQPGPSTSSIGEADVQAWMRAFCERYPKTKTIEVVSEPPPHTTPPYANNMGIVGRWRPTGHEQRACLEMA